MRLATVDDLARLARTGMRAFANDPLFRWMMPDDDAYESELGELMMRLMFRRWIAVGEVWTAEDCVALSAWQRPDTPDAPSLPDDVGAELGAIVARFPQDLLDRLAHLRPILREHRPSEPHWYLNILATHPDWQRQGLGMTMMSQVRDRCDRDGVGQYLETATEEDIAYYRSRGFDVLSTWTVDTVSMAGMWRAAGAGNR